MNNVSTAIAALYARGGHLVKCGYHGNIKAAYPGWQTHLVLRDALEHMEHGHQLGLIPWSLGLSVLDVDEGAAMKVGLAFPPLVTIPTLTDGHAHLYYRDSAPRSNRKWELLGCSGEVRSASGYVVLWNDAAERLEDALATFADLGQGVSFPWTEITGEMELDQPPAAEPFSAAEVAPAPPQPPTTPRSWPGDGPRRKLDDPGTGQTYDPLVVAKAAIINGLDYNGWVGLIAALKQLGCTLAEVDAVSQENKTFYKPGEVAERWAKLPQDSNSPAAVVNAAAAATACTIRLLDRPKGPTPRKTAPVAAQGGAGAEEGWHDWGWVDLGTLVDEPPRKFLIPGLLVEGGVTLLYGPTKVGKSRMLFGMLKSLSPDGPKFCGMEIPDAPTLLFSEETTADLGGRVRDFIIPIGHHQVNTLGPSPKDADGFAEEVHHSYVTHGAGFGLIVVDTIGPFIKCENWNDYTMAGAALAPFSELSRALPKVAIMLIHHSNKGGADDFSSVLGSTVITAMPSQIVRLGRRKGQLHITVGGRAKADPFPWDTPTPINVSEAGVEMAAQNGKDFAGELLAEYLGSTPVTIQSLLVAMDEDRLTVTILRNALDEKIRAGKAEIVTEGSGRRGATYRSL